MFWDLWQERSAPLSGSAHADQTSPTSPPPCSPYEAQVLARAVKEHERRDGRREGFADTPADVLAYKYFRDVSRGLRGCGGLVDHSFRC